MDRLNGNRETARSQAVSRFLLYKGKILRFEEKFYNNSDNILLIPGKYGKLRVKVGNQRKITIFAISY